MNDEHYLEEIILKSTEGSDTKIIKKVKERLPENFIVNSDDTFLVIEYEDLDKYSSRKIVKSLDLPFESVSYITTKRCYGHDNIILYLSWDKIIDDMNILT